MLRVSVEGQCRSAIRSRKLAAAVSGIDGIGSASCCGRNWTGSKNWGLRVKTQNAQGRGDTTCCIIFNLQSETVDNIWIEEREREKQAVGWSD
jgi:hypothetical protein